MVIVACSILARATWIEIIAWAKIMRNPGFADRRMLEVTSAM
jgi:hypothetical protein